MLFFLFWWVEGKEISTGHDWCCCCWCLAYSFSDGDGDDNSGSSDSMSNGSDINPSFGTLEHSLEYAKIAATGMPSFNQSTVAVNRGIQLGKDGQTPGQLLRLLEQGMPSSLLSCDWKVEPTT